MNSGNTSAVTQGQLMDEDEFEDKLIALCEAFGVHEFAIYGRYAPTINKDGLLCPPNRLVWLNGETMVAEEAIYHLQRIADGKEP